MVLKNTGKRIRLLVILPKILTLIQTSQNCISSGMNRDENLPLFGGNPLFSSKNMDPRNFRRFVEFFLGGVSLYFTSIFEGKCVDWPSPTKGNDSTQLPLDFIPSLSTASKGTIRWCLHRLKSPQLCIPFPPMRWVGQGRCSHCHHGDQTF